MPNIWKASEFLVAASSRNDSRLSSSNPMAPSTAPDHSERRGACGFARSVNMVKNSSTLAARPSAIVSTSTTGSSSSSRVSQLSRSVANPLTSPVTATLTSSVAPISVSVTRSRSLPTTKFGCSRSGSSNTTTSACTHRGQPAQAGVEQADDADDARDSGSLLERGEVDVEPLEESFECGGQDVLGLREDLRDVADDEERESQDREEREKAEVGDRARLEAAVDVAVVVHHPQDVIDERTSTADLVESCARRRHHTLVNGNARAGRQPLWSSCR